MELSRVHRAGPREKIYFRPEEVKAAIVTCGGLCPGLNDVIRQVLVMTHFIIVFNHIKREVLFNKIIILRHCRNYVAS